jgi:hypothetical protein
MAKPAHAKASENSVFFIGELLIFMVPSAFRGFGLTLTAHLRRDGAVPLDRADPEEFQYRPV